MTSSEVPLPSFGLAEREPLETELTRKLVQYLASAGLRSGQRLPSERQMAEALGVGRAALRHALKFMSLLGMLEVRPSSGTYLRNGHSDLLPRVLEWGVLLGEQRTEDVIEARSVLEVVLAGMAAERRTPEDLERLTALISRMHEPTDAADYVDLDVRFHLAVADAARNDIFAGVLRSLQSLLHVWALRVISAAGETSSSLAMHVPVLDAIVASDPDAARDAMAAHMDRASRRLRDAVASHP